MLEDHGQEGFVESGKEFCVQTDTIGANGQLEWGGRDPLRSPVSFCDIVSRSGFHDDTGEAWG